VKQVKKIDYTKSPKEIGKQMAENVSKKLKLNLNLSEPQVCPKPEQMVICPNPCKDETCGHRVAHIEMVVCSNELRPKTCPPCCVSLPPELQPHIEKECQLMNDCSECKSIQQLECKKHSAPDELLTDEFQSWLDGKCTCGMCPEGIAYAYHETNPNKWYGKSFLCLYHKTHGNEGMVYVPVKEAVKLLYIAKAQLLELKAQNNRKVWISELEAEISQAQSQARVDQLRANQLIKSETEARVRSELKDYVCEECSTPNFINVVVPLRIWTEWGNAK
jgi:hypothetical protein